MTTDPSLMRQEAIHFYTKVFGASECDLNSQDKIVEGLPQLEESEEVALDSPISLEEMTKAAQQLSCGRAPGIDGLPPDFYKKFWTLLGSDVHAVLTTALHLGRLPVSCLYQRRGT